MIKLLEGATITQGVSARVQMFLVYVERALGDGNPLEGQKKWRSIMRKLERFEHELPKGGG